jgi:hypothetical protein
MHYLLGCLGCLLLFPCLTSASSSASAASSATASSSFASPNPDVTLVKAHVAANAHLTFRPASGVLKFPYLVPGGPYNQTWDWDSLFMGVAMRNHGSTPYLAGTMRNFLDHTNVSTGQVQGGLTPEGATNVIYHAKPVIIQGAWLAAKGDAALIKEMRAYQPQMEALLAYWGRAPRVDPRTGLRVWHDQLESGSDNLATSACPSLRSPCWNEATDAFTLASADVNMFLHREHLAFARFAAAWGDLPLSRTHEAASRTIVQAINTHLWREDLGYYVALNVSTGKQIEARVWLMGLPLWGGAATPAQMAKVVDNIVSSDMLSPWGVRSTSAADPRYDNTNEIKPYSNWRGPIWTNANALLMYGASSYGGKARRVAVDLARNVTRALADDLRATGTWHECLSADTGKGLAAPGFLSWDTLIGTLYDDVAAGHDPFAL